MPSNNVASIALTAKPSALSTGLNAAYRMVANFAKLSQQTLQSLNLAPRMPKDSHPLSVGRVALATAVGTATKRGLDLIIDQGKAIFEFNDKLVRFGIAAKKSGVALEFVGRTARQVSNETGVNANSVLDTARAYVDLAGAANFTTEKMRILSRAGQVSEASGADIAGMMYQLTTSMRVADDQIENTMGGLINQAKEGAIEAKQMAREFGAMMPLYAKFGVLGREGAIQAGAMFQVVRDGYNTADEAGTGIVRIFAGIRSQASRFEKAGVKIWNVDKNGFKTARQFSEIFRDINNSQLAKDPELLKKAFGRTEAWRGWEILSKNVERLHEMEAAGRANGVIAQDLATYTESAGGRIAVAMEKMKNAIAEAFTPERINHFVTAIEELSTQVAPLVEMFGKIGDGINWIYSAGKKLRGWAGSGGLMKEFIDPKEIDAYMIQHGMQRGFTPQGEANAKAAYAQMITDRTRANSLIRDIGNLMRDDKTTPASNRRAMESFLHSASGSDERMMADSYFAHAGLDVRQMRQLMKEVSDDEVKSARAAPGGEEQMQRMATFLNDAAGSIKYLAGSGSNDNFFNPATRVDLVSKLSELITVLGRLPQIADNKQIVLDGNQVGRGVQDATHARRR